MAAVTRAVRYTVPVVVLIEDDRIARVVVDDEQPALAEEVTPEVAGILEASEWPAWEFGW